MADMRTKESKDLLSRIEDAEAALLSHDPAYQDEYWTLYPEAKLGNIDVNDNTTRRILEDLTDRACRDDAIRLGIPKTLSGFTDWLRGLFPELYNDRTG